ncbi:alpha-ketoglutarate-dependent dioxygenase AlkB family protein [Methylomarinum vadi]|uniref:alpha-ketoglutarate-dependent dioxygenase AlkB family protein n=1 Tax=Methylomarinum vadi TaxID=438855 RepID=UPI0004DEEBA0|nr:alpha-ketoglutarate-dependent dioxygenase AlkB [Methylomarinum vadi]
MAGLFFNAENLAPIDGELYLIREFYPPERADSFFQTLLDELDWRQEQILIYGRQVGVPRLMCWYGDPGMHYHYSGTDHSPTPWTGTLLRIKADVEKACAVEFNSVMANLYRNERDSMGCHADDEKELGINPLIASLSFGERRLMRFRHKKQRQKLELELGHGDLLLMAGELQHHWRHELPKTRQPKKARINLTFRRIYPGT